jgi:hypothetical protein
MQKLTANANHKRRICAAAASVSETGLSAATLNLTWIMGNTNGAIYRKLDLTFDKLMQATNSV